MIKVNMVPICAQRIDWEVSLNAEPIGAIVTKDSLSDGYELSTFQILNTEAWA